MPSCSQVTPADANVVGRRAIAFAFDVLVVAALAALVIVPANLALTSLGTPALSANSPAGLSTAIAALVMWAYFTLPETIFGSTVGKLAVGIRVVCIDCGTKPTFRQAAIRNLGLFVDGLLLGAPAAVAVATSPLRQRVGDRWANTAVVAYRR